MSKVPQGKTEAYYYLSLNDLILGTNGGGPDTGALVGLSTLEIPPGLEGKTRPIFLVDVASGSVDEDVREVVEVASVVLRK